LETEKGHFLKMTMRNVNGNSPLSNFANVDDELSLVLVSDGVDDAWCSRNVEASPGCETEVPGSAITNAAQLFQIVTIETTAFRSIFTCRYQKN
jgi:hypothetical protein